MRRVVPPAHLVIETLLAIDWRRAHLSVYLQDFNVSSCFQNDPLAEFKKADSLHAYDSTTNPSGVVLRSLSLRGALSTCQVKAVKENDQLWEIWGLL